MKKNIFKSLRTFMRRFLNVKFEEEKIQKIQEILKPQIESEIKENHTEICEFCKEIVNEENLMCLEKVCMMSMNLILKLI